MINRTKMQNKFQFCYMLLISIICLSSFNLVAYSRESTSDEVSEDLVATHSIGENSQASFSIFEVLLGNDKTVVGTTSMVMGESSFDINDPQSAQIGTIVIDARDFKTDDNRRNGAIQRRVLNTNQEGNEFVTFETTAIEGLPEAVAVGDSFELMVTGNLTIIGTTLEEVFTVNVTVNSESELEGVGTATIMYKDYGVTIPKVPVVARVADELTLKIAFTAGPPAETK